MLNFVWSRQLESASSIIPLFSRSDTSRLTETVQGLCRFGFHISLDHLARRLLSISASKPIQYTKSSTQISFINLYVCAIQRKANTYIFQFDMSKLMAYRSGGLNLSFCEQYIHSLLLRYTADYSTILVGMAPNLTCDKSALEIIASTACTSPARATALST